MKKIILFLCLLIVGQSCLLFYLYKKVQLNQQFIQVDQQPIIENKIIHLHSPEELENILQNNQDQAVLFFHMPKCGWCKKAEPEYEKLVKNQEFKFIKFYSIDGVQAQAPAILQKTLQQNITGYPTFILVDKNEYKDKMVGFKNPQDLDAKIRATFMHLPVQDIDSKEHTPFIQLDTQDQLRAVLTTNQYPKVLFFYKDQCGWCKKMHPVFEKVALKKEFNFIKFYAINAQLSQASQVISEELHQTISGYPTFFFIDKNSAISKVLGFKKEEDFEQAIKNAFFTQQDQVVIQAAAPKKQPIIHHISQQTTNNRLRAIQINSNMPIHILHLNLLLLYNKGIPLKRIL